MSFAYTKDSQEAHGYGLKVTSGTYTSAGGGTGGAIVTGLGTVIGIFLQPNGSAVLATMAVIDSATQSMPCSVGSVTVITPADQTGSWTACGI